MNSLAVSVLARVLPRAFAPLVLLAVHLVSCAPPEPPDAAPKPPDVVLITLDTLRADHLGSYGAGPGRTPNLDRLAASATLFEHASAPLPETRPSHFTLLTGQYPRTHGAVSNRLTLPPEALTLAEVFQGAGYHTGAFVGCVLLAEGSGAEQGFAVLDAPQEPQRPAQDVVPRALDWLAGLDDDKPFFLWVHLFDPHLPYEPPQPPAPGDDEADVAAISWPSLLDIARQHDGNLPRRYLQRAEALYRAEVAHTDAWVGRLLDALDARPRGDRTVLAVTADHGECFGNGVYFDHSHCLDEGALAVPLLLRGPDVEAGRRVSAQVEHTDVAPTLLRLAGLDVPPSFEGRGLLARAASAAMPSDPATPSDPAADAAFFQYPFYRQIDLDGRREIIATLRTVAGEPLRPVPGGLRVGVKRGRWKYLRSGEEAVLHDLQGAAEKRDVAPRQKERAAELEKLLRRWLRDHPLHEIGDAEINPELRGQLEALGYL